jgi:hypothetical protein
MKEYINKETREVLTFIKNKYSGLYTSSLEELQSTIEFIQQNKGVINLRTDEEGNFLGDLGEVYVRGLMSEMNVKKAEDFEVTINGKVFIVQVKSTSNLFKSFIQIIYELHDEAIDNEELRKKIDYLLENFDITISPFYDIHRKIEEHDFKKELKIIIMNFELRNKQQNFFIEVCCNNYYYKKYTIEIKPKEIKIKGIYSGAGRPHDKTKSLAKLLKDENILKQISHSDIFLVVLMSKNIRSDKIIEVIYKPRDLSLLSTKEIEKMIENKLEIKIPTITQYEEESIWRHPSAEQLKCFIFIYPVSKIALFCPSVKCFKNFDAPEYFILTRKFKEKGISSHFAYLNIASCSIE